MCYLPKVIPGSRDEAGCRLLYYSDKELILIPEPEEIPAL